MERREIAAKRRKKRKKRKAKGETSKVTQVYFGSEFTG
jgi:hypothetical protein